MGAFLNRFAIGFVLGTARLEVPAWANGLIFGVLLSLTDAIITKTYAPILILGAVGGVIIGFVVDKWGTDSFPNCDAGYSRFGTPVLASVVRSGISGSFSKVRIVLLPS